MSRARHPRPVVTRSGLGWVALGVPMLLVTGQLASGATASAAPQPAPLAAATTATFVDLGQAAAFSVLGGTSVANTGAGTVLARDLGLSPTGAITGFPLGTVDGTVHDKDATAEAAQSDRADAYAAAADQQSTSTFSGDQAGVTFHPGVHTSAAAFSNTGTITLDADGDSSAVFVFQIGAALSSAASSKVVLTDGALANNVFWQVVGAVSLGAGAKYVGTFLAAGAVTFGDGASIKGRALSPGAIALTNSPFTEPIDDLTAPTVTLDGGATRSTNDSTPTIAGTTDEPVGKAVTVTLAGQTLSSTVGAGGSWSVGATALSSGPHNVVASITDASQNTGTATQVLTVDVTAPVVSINGGAMRSTNVFAPPISGTTDEPGNTTVTVTVGGQTLTTTASEAGTWSVDAATLTEAPHSVEASVTDAAQNIGTAAQILSVDATVPVVTIDGGEARSTDDTSPWIYGTTAEQAGTVVQVTVAGQVLTATVLAGGTWGVSATTLNAGPHRVVASITDAAQNTGTATQDLTVTGHGGPTGRYQPDAAIRQLNGTFLGVGIYDVSKQQVTKRLRGHVRSVTFEVLVTNRGQSTDRMVLRGTPRSRMFTVTYFAGGRDVTRAVTVGMYSTNPLVPGDSARLFIKVTRTRAASPGATRTFAVTASSWHARTAWDTVAAVVKVTRGSGRSAT
ncbi:MAG TPA: ice-binding family protein [Nocardioidaceae bacterium]|nr:ice-binding family protein [Nocardioidaceae bacterium]